jgi:hypothetical protein
LIAPSLAITIFLVLIELERGTFDVLRRRLASPKPSPTFGGEDHDPVRDFQQIRKESPGARAAPQAVGAVSPFGTHCSRCVGQDHMPAVSGAAKAIAEIILSPVSSIEDDADALLADHEGDPRAARPNSLVASDGAPPLLASQASRINAARSPRGNAANDRLASDGRPPGTGHPPWIFRGKSADLIQPPKLVFAEREFSRREIVLKRIETFRANGYRGHLIYHRSESPSVGRSAD